MSSRDRKVSEKRWQRVLQHMSSTLPSLNEERAAEILRNAKADQGISLRQLDRHFLEVPDALGSGASDCPLVLIRLVELLVNAGIEGVVRPGCSQCGAVGVDLSRKGIGGRVCTPCNNRLKRLLCARCGRLERIAARWEGEPVCYRCYSNDPRITVECSSCGRLRAPRYRSPGGSVLCSNCAPKPIHVCSVCGDRAPAHSRVEGQAVCKHCYRAPQRACGQCGKNRPTKIKGFSGRVDLCAHCYYGPENTCTTCGLLRQCRRSRVTGEYTCEQCYRRPTRICSWCGRDRQIHARWPGGPVCDTCYNRTLSEPGDCGGCGKRRALIATNSFGRRVCGPCGGSRVDYLCRTCGEAGFPYQDGNCDRCVLKVRLRDLFSDQGGLIKPEIQPLIEVLESVPRPYRTLQWLAKGRAAQLLVRVAREDRKVSHELLDEMPLGPAADYARSALVHTRVLPERVEHFGRLETWSKNLLVGKPAHHVRLVRPFIQWHIILRVRRKVQRHQLSYGAAQSTRRRISIAIQFLDWLDRRGRLFEEVSQEDVDQWLAEGSTPRYQVRYFLGWAVSRHLIDPVLVPCRTQANPEVVLDEDDHIQQIHRCVNDGEIPLDVRVAGALVLVFGATLARIVCLTVDDLVHEDGESYVSLGRKPLLLPPKLACLAKELADSPRSLSVIGAAAGASHWLFPGRRVACILLPEPLPRG